MPLIDLAMPAEQYHAIDAVSASLLKQIAKSPAHAKAYLSQQQEPTPAMLFGTAFHTCVLEYERFHTEYAVFTGDKRTKDGKATYEALVAEGKTIITQSDYECIMAMADAIETHPAANALMNLDHKTEVSVFWDDEETGLACKCRPDILAGKVIIDLKTTDDASQEGFARSIHTYGYGIQAAHYLASGTGAESFVFVAVEKKAPYAVAVYELDPLSLDFCESNRRSLLEYWANCREADMFPAYSDDCVLISLPAWAMKNSLGNENV